MNYRKAMSSETRKVIDSVLRGDHATLASALARHRDYLRRVVTLRMPELLQARIDPSDIVQETQLEVMRRVHQYACNPELPLRLWMRRIAVDRLESGPASPLTNRQTRSWA